MANEVSDALSSVGTTLTTQINPGVIASVVGVVLGACIALFLTWFGIRKLIRAIKSALKGRLAI